jgi:FKBP-type peptidyl-prolyl cis-trans isomerase
MTEQLQSPERPAADEPTGAESDANARRRGQAVVGALAGVAVILVLVAVFVGVKVGGDDPARTSAAAPAPTAPAAPAAEPTAQPSEPAAQPSEPAAQEPSRPAPVNTPAALRNRPAVAAGGAQKLAKLKVTSLVKGTGPKVRTGQTITANYVLATYADGKVIQATWDMDQSVPLTVGQLIPGFDQGIIGVPVGSRVQMDIPSKLAYGDQPANGAPAGDLRFIVDVLAAQ